MNSGEVSILNPRKQRSQIRNRRSEIRLTAEMSRHPIRWLLCIAITRRVDSKRHSIGTNKETSAIVGCRIFDGERRTRNCWNDQRESSGVSRDSVDSSTMKKTLNSSLFWTKTWSSTTTWANNRCCWYSNYCRDNELSRRFSMQW